MASIIINIHMATPEQKRCVELLESYAFEFHYGLNDVVRLALIRFANNEYELCEIMEKEMFAPVNKKIKKNV